MINGIVQNNALGRKTERWIEPSWLIADTGRASLGRVARQPGEIQFCPRLKNNRSLQFMRQFAHIAGPTVAQQFSATRFGDFFLRQPMFLADPLCKQLGQFQNIFSPLTQRGNADPIEVQPMV